MTEHDQRTKYISIDDFLRFECMALRQPASCAKILVTPAPLSVLGDDDLYVCMYVLLVLIIFIQLPKA